MDVYVATFLNATDRHFGDFQTDVILKSTHARTEVLRGAYTFGDWRLSDRCHSEMDARAHRDFCEAHTIVNRATFRRVVLTKLKMPAN